MCILFLLFRQIFFIIKIKWMLKILCFLPSLFATRDSKWYFSYLTLSNAFLCRISDSNERETCSLQSHCFFWLPFACLSWKYIWWNPLILLHVFLFIFYIIYQVTGKTVSISSKTITSSSLTNMYKFIKSFLNILLTD